MIKLLITNLDSGYTKNISRNTTVNIFTMDQKLNL